jgi:starvation-inducible DNA-binding protein
MSNVKNFNTIKSDELPISIGINEKNRKEIAKGLSGFLADSFTLYLITHNFHWNVTGAQFNSLHALFMAQYTEQWNALDTIAERIRSLGHFSPGTYQEFMALTSIKEVTSPPDSNTMLKLLVKAQEAAAKTAKQVFETADQANDQPTADLLTQRLEVHEKNAWMLRSSLDM